MNMSLCSLLILGRILSLIVFSISFGSPSFLSPSSISFSISVVLRARGI